MHFEREYLKVILLLMFIKAERKEESPQLSIAISESFKNSEFDLKCRPNALFNSVNLRKEA